MKSDSGREHVRRIIGIFLVLVGMRGNFEGTRNRVIDGCSRGGGRRLCKEDVGRRLRFSLTADFVRLTNYYIIIIVDLNNFLASWSLRSDMVGRSARKMALVKHMACRVHKGK